MSRVTITRTGKPGRIVIVGGRSAAQAKGRERYTAFLSAVAKRVGQEASTAREVLDERVAT